MYDVGILGGMGSKATATVFNLIVDNTLAKTDQEHLNIAVLNIADIPDRTDFLLGKCKSNPLLKIQEGIKQLNFLNVNNVIIPCNTSHYFIEDISKNSNAKIINMVDSTLSYVKKVNGELACVLSTIGTAKTGVYNKYEKEGLEIFYPDECFASDIHEIIYKIKNGNTDLNEMAIKLKNIMDKIANQHEKPITFILACTELSIVNKEYFKGHTVVDALEISALLSILKSNKQIIKNKLNYDYKVIENL